MGSVALEEVQDLEHIRASGLIGCVHGDPSGLWNDPTCVVLWLLIPFKALRTLEHHLSFFNWLQRKQEMTKLDIMCRPPLDIGTR